MTAANASGTYGYNLSYRVVLPAGVTYAGGAPVAPSELVDQPAPGEATLLFENVSDLSPGSSHNAWASTSRTPTSPMTPATAFDVKAQAFVNSDPRYVPKFTATGAPNGPSATSYTGLHAPESAAPRR